MKNKSRTGLFILILCTALFMSVSAIAKDKVKPQLESLLKEGKIEYIKTDDGWLKIPFTVEDETSMILMNEVNIIDKNPSTAYIHIFALVATLPDKFTVPLVMMKELNTINNNLDFGKVVITNDVGAIYYDSGIWSINASIDNLMFELYTAHYQRLALRKTLLPYINE